MRRCLSWLPPTLVLAAVCLFPSSASAVYTGDIASSAITTPSGPTYVLDVSDASDAERRLDVVGRITGAANGEDIEIRCYYDTVYLTIATVPVAGDGTFSADDVLLPLDEMCHLRGVPETWGDNRDIARWASVPVGVSERYSNSADDYFGTTGRPNTILTFSTDIQQVRGYFEFEEAGGCAVDEAEVYLGPNSGDAYKEQFDCGNFAIDEETDYGTPGVLVDGEQAYLPTDQAQAGDVPGLSFTTLSTSVDRATGNATIVEGSEFRHCVSGGTVQEGPGDLGTGDCDSFVPSGLRLERTMRTDRDGQRLWITDRFVSTDGAAHTVEINYSHDFYNSDVGVGVLGEAPLEREAYYRLRFSRSPASVVINSDTNEAEGNDDSAGSAITYYQSPDDWFMESDDDAVATFRNRTVPAGGALELRLAFNNAHRWQDAAEQARALEDATDAPSVAITAPANGSATADGTVIARGTASDPSDLRTVTVNGVRAPLADDGSWSVPLTLQPGVNTITAVARDGAGQQTQVATTVTYQPPAPPVQVVQQIVTQVREQPIVLPFPTCTVPRLRGRTRASAERALVRARCAVGDLKRTRRLSRSVKKNRVLSQSRPAGTLVPAGTEIWIKINQPKAKASKPKKGKRARKARRSTTRR